MANAFSRFESFDFFRVQDVYDPLQGYESYGGMMNKGHQTQTQLFGSQDWGNVDSLCSQYGFYQENAPQVLSLAKDQFQQQLSDFGMLDDLEFDVVSPPFQSPQQSLGLNSVLSELSELIQPKKEKLHDTSIASLELLNGYNCGFKRRKGEKISMQPSQSQTSSVLDGQRLSTEEVMRVAGAQYIQSSDQHEDHLSMLMQPYGTYLSGLIDEEIKDIQLAHLLLAAAEKVGNQQFERGGRLLTQCDYLSSSIGSPVQRVVYYFAEALRERIFRETGRTPLKGFPMVVKKEELEINAAMLTPNPELLAYHQRLPFSQVMQFSGVQAIIENVASARRIHLIDLSIKIGIPWTALMQALAARHGCPIELFKITAVGMTNKEKIEETGKRLASFAEGMGLPFSFQVVMVSDMKDVKQELFELDDDEAIAIYAPFILRTMINRPDRLDSLMRVMRNLNPCLMVVTEVEANHNSPSFFNRFIEALFFYGAFFDSLEAGMDRNDKNRITTESQYLGQAIMNMVATEGEERKHRHVRIDVWRAFFARFGWVETEFSHSSMYQANLLLKQFTCGSSCTLDLNGKCLTIGWKGTPIHSLSAWKLN